MDDEPEGALELLERILSDNPRDVEAMSLKGAHLEFMGAFLEARWCYEAVLDLEPENARALVDIGDTYDATDDLESALTFYDRVIQASKPGSEEGLEDAYVRKCLALRRAGRIDEARQCLEMARRKLPGSEKFKDFRL